MPGERLLWFGKPEQRRFFQPGDLVVMLAAGAFLASALLWEAMVIKSGAGEFMRLWGIPFIGWGLYLVIGQPVLRFIRLGSTRYAVTDRRVIEIADRPRRRRTEHYLRDLPPPVYRSADGEMTGSVAFGAFPGYQDALQEMNLPSGRKRDKPLPIVLRDIGQPRYVRDLIASAQAGGGA
jgi:hypothetical protein